MLNVIKPGLVSRELRGDLHVQTELVHPLRVLQPMGPNVKDLSCLSPKENLLLARIWRLPYTSASWKRGLNTCDRKLND